MQTRRLKKYEKALWLQQRDIQKRNARKVRLNICAGILRRFYNKFIYDFKLARQVNVKFAVVEEETKKIDMPQKEKERK